MKKIFCLFIVIALFSCKSDLDKKVNAKDALDCINRICEELDNNTCNKLHADFKTVLIYHEYGDRGSAAIIQKYSKTFNDLTIRDLLNKCKEN